MVKLMPNRQDLILHRKKQREKEMDSHLVQAHEVNYYFYFKFHLLNQRPFFLLLPLRSQQFELLNESQKVNHFPGCFQLGRKDTLSWNIRNFTPLQNSDYFHPNTYILPHDLPLLRKRWICGEMQSKLLILKPPASARGMVTN